MVILQAIASTHLKSYFIKSLLYVKCLIKPNLEILKHLADPFKIKLSLEISFENGKLRFIIFNNKFNHD